MIPMPKILKIRFRTTMLLKNLMKHQKNMWNIWTNKLVCDYKHSNNTLKIILIQFSGTREDFDDVLMDETSRETLDRTSKESTHSPAVKRSRSRSTTPRQRFLKSSICPSQNG